MKRIAYILSVAALLFACSPMEINHPTEADAPATATSFTPVISVDQEINQVTFSLNQAGYVPVWVFQDSKGEWSEYKTGDGLKKIYTAAGDYSVRMFVSNAAGMSPDYVEGSFHIDNSIVNFDRYIRYISGGSSKVWRIDNSVPAHQACGESVENPAGWWSASADEKAGTGLYDNRLTFTSEGAYTFDPGTAGTVYVNAGVTVEPFASSNTGDGQDYTVAVSAAESTYSFSVEGDAIYLELPAGSLFPYIPNNEFVKDSKFRVVSIDNNAMTLVWYTATGNNGSAIAWQFILTSKAGAYVFNGYDYNAASNLWKPVDPADAHSYFFYYAPGWNQIADPSVELNNGAYSLSLPSATSDQWQAQFHITPATALALNADTHYDFSAIVSTNKDLPGVTFKLTDASDDGVFLFVERVKVPAGSDFIFYLNDLEGIASSAVKLVLDFGGNADGTEVTVSRITLKDHAIDDGTILPGTDEPVEPEEGAHYDITGSTNLWRSATIESMSYYYAPGWNQIADPGFEAKDYVYTVSLPEATSDQWQAQVAFHTNISSAAGKKYDFCCTLNSNNDHPGVTIKLVKEGDDGVFYFADRHKLTAGTDFVYKVPNLDGIDMEKISLFFDFGGCAAGTEVEIRDICFQEHQDPQGGGSVGQELVYDSASNLWKPVDAADGHTYSQFYAPGWSQLADREVTLNGNKYTIVYPTATTDQWQAQFFIIPTDATKVSLSAAKKYDFQVKINSSTDHSRITLKLVDTSDDGKFLFTETVTAKAYEDETYTFTNLAGIDAESVKMVFDFGGNADNTEISISEIILHEHTDSGSGSSGAEGTEIWPSDNDYTISYYYAPGWSPIADPACNASGGKFTWTLPSATTDQWQAQVLMVPNTAVAVSAGKKYDFACTLESSTAIANVTVKVHKLNDDGTPDDGTFLFTENIALEPYTEKVVTLTDKNGFDAKNVRLVLDFGGNPDNTEVSISGISLKEK